MGAPVLTGFDHKVIVGLAEMVISNNPSVILTTYSLGSCLGVAIYDPVARVGGLLHAMLPTSDIDREKAMKQPGMFLDTGIPALFRAAYELKAEKHRIKVYLAGGAQIMDNSGFFSIGKRNFAKATEIFQQHGLSVQSEETGGLVNRTMYLKLATGEVSLKISGKPTDVPLCRNSTTT
jgi:chemotaxis protein CheD